MKIENVRVAQETEYMKFSLADPSFSMGITHHPTGLGKLKVYDQEAKKEYAVPVEDLMKPMSEWRVDKR